MAKSYELPPIMSEEEQQELEDFGVWLMSLCAGYPPEERAIFRRFQELIEIATWTMDEWRKYLESM